MVKVDGANSYYSSVDGILFNKAQTVIIQYPVSKIGSYVIPTSVISIGVGVFYSCIGLTSVTIPASVTSIGDGAFGNCSGLTSIYANAATPENLNSMGEVFYNVNINT